MARTREALQNSWDKNDPLDAQVILHLLKTSKTNPYHDPVVAGHNDLQELSNAHAQLSLRRTRLMHSIVNHYLAIYFPEAEKFMQASRAHWFGKLLENTAHDLLADNRDYQILRTIPGIGPIVALTVLAEAGDMRRFGHERQYLKFCGLDLATQQSGTFRGTTKLSKRGNARLRSAYWLASTVAVRMRENSFRHKFDRYVRSDPSNRDLCRKAYTAVTGKLARVSYHLVTKQLEYRPFHEVGVPSGRTRSVRAVEANATS